MAARSASGSAWGGWCCFAVGTFATITVLLLLLVLAGFGTLPVIIVLLFCANAFLGVVMPTTMVMALDPHPRHRRAWLPRSAARCRC